MLNGKLKGHQDLWQALVRVEKMFATMKDEVRQLEAYTLVHATMRAPAFALAWYVQTLSLRIQRQTTDAQQPQVLLLLLLQLYLSLCCCSKLSAVWLEAD